MKSHNVRPDLPPLGSKAAYWPRSLHPTLWLRLAVAALCLSMPFADALAQSSPKPEPSRPRRTSPAKPQRKSPEKAPQPAQQPTPAPQKSPQQPAQAPKKPVHVPIPRRAPLPEVNLSDERACFRELADLASLSGPGVPDSREPAVGWYPYPASDVAMERVVRFDHLMASQNEQVRVTAGKLRQIVFDNWSVNRLEELYGDTIEDRVADYRAAMSSQFRAIVAELWDNEQPKTEQLTYYDSAGNQRTTTVARDVDYSLSETARESYKKLRDELRANNMKRREVSASANAARELLAVELQTLWNKSIGPNLPATSTQPLTLKLHESRSGPVYQGQSLREVRDGVAPGPLLSNDISIYIETTNQPLTNVTASFVVRDEYGLEVRDVKFLKKISEAAVIFRPFGLHSQWLGHSTEAVVSIRILADEGEWNVSDVPFRPTGMGCAIVARTPKATREAMRAQVQAEYDELANHGKALLHLARDLFRPPPNPVPHVKLLGSKVRPGDTFNGNFSDGGELYTVTLTIDSIDETTGLYLGHATHTFKGKPEKERLVRGRLIEEAERGAAIGFCRYNVGSDEVELRDNVRESLEKRLARLPEAEREQYRQKLQQSEDRVRQASAERNASLHQQWTAGDVWLISSPSEIKSLKRTDLVSDAFLVGEMGYRPQHLWGWEVQKARAKQAVCAELALYASPDGKLMMQSSLSPETKTINHCVAVRK